MSLLLAISTIQMNAKREISGTRPGEATNLGVDMPGTMDHIETVTMIEADLFEQDTDKHKVKEIGRKLAAQDDSSERWSYETIQKCIDDHKQNPSRAREFVAKNKKNFRPRFRSVRTASSSSKIWPLSLLRLGHSYA